jgi:tol-pal system protein YbgF
MKYGRLILIGLCSVLSWSVYAADIPVVDLSGNQGEDQKPYRSMMHRSPVTRVNTGAWKDRQDVNRLGFEERVERLERQIDYLEQLQLSAEIDQLRRTVQDLRGLVEVQTHELQALREQQRYMYADLDKRVSGGKTTMGKQQLDFSNQTVLDEEVKAYEAAFQLIKTKQYGQAIFGFENYLKQYPGGQYVVNAHYWLGELFMISGDVKQSKREFEVVVNKYNQSEKVPDALLKLGMIANDQLDFSEAKKQWQTLVKKFPNSSAAHIAKIHLNS